MPLSVTKVLEPGAPPICFTKRDSGFLEVTLRWSAPIDIDLATMYEDDEGKKDVVQALGTDPGRFGRFGKSPYIKLDRDDRSGGQEIVTINLARANQLRRFLVFAYVWDGTMRDVRDATVTVKHPDDGEHVIHLGHGSGMSCVLARFETLPNGDTRFYRDGTFFNGTHIEIDRAYNWNIRWNAPQRKS